MEPLSLSASVIAVLQLSGTVLSYLNSAKNLDKDLAKLTIEASNIYSLLIALRFRLEEAGEGLTDPWAQAVRNLGAENGPLDQLQQALLRIVAKLEPADGIRKIGKHIRWKFEKTEIDEVLNRIERLKSLINLALANDLFQLSLAIKSELSKVDDGMSEIRAGVITLQMEQQTEYRTEIEQWLSSHDFRSRQMEILKGAQADTRQWLFDSSQFQHWMTGDRGTLWCPGIPGAGKTVTSAIIVNHLQSKFKDSNVAVTCLFCNYKDRQEQTAEGFMANLLKQLMQDRAEISEAIRDLYVKRKKEFPTFEALAEAFAVAITHYSDVFVILDALDETMENNDIRTRLVSKLDSLPIRLLVTSRHDVGIERTLIHAQRLEIEATAEDVRTYVEARIPSEPLLARHINADPSLRSEIVARVVDMSQGMFLMARFHMDSLVTKTKRKDVRKALKVLPPGLDESYDRTMERIENQPKEFSELGKGVIMWVGMAYHPLSPKGIQHALAVDADMTEICDDDLDDADTLLAACAGLVILDTETDTLRFVHYTTQEYFDRKGESWLGDVCTQTASTCVRYLTFSNFTDDPNSDEDAILQPLSDSFFHYAALRWAAHVRRSSAPAVTELALKFLAMSKNLGNAFRAMTAFHLWSDWSDSYASTTLNALHVAAMLGLDTIVAALLASGASADKRDSFQYTPLLLASEMGHVAVVELLLDRDDVNAEARLSSLGLQTALTLAAYSGHDAVVRVLLRHGVNRSSYDKALDYAANRRHCAVVETLLKAGAHIRFSTLKGAIAQPHGLEEPHVSDGWAINDEAQRKLTLDVLKKYGADFDHGLDLFEVAIAQGTSYDWLRDEGFASEYFKNGEPRGDLLWLITHYAGVSGLCPPEMFD